MFEGKYRKMGDGEEDTANFHCIVNVGFLLLACGFIFIAHIPL